MHGLVWMAQAMAEGAEEEDDEDYVYDVYSIERCVDTFTFLAKSCPSFLPPSLPPSSPTQSYKHHPCGLSSLLPASPLLALSLHRAGSKSSQQQSPAPHDDDQDGVVMMEGQQPPVVAVRGLAYSSKAGQDEEEEEDAAVLVFEDDSDWVSGEGWLGGAARVYAYAYRSHERHVYALICLQLT